MKNHTRTASPAVLMRGNRGTESPASQLPAKPSKTTVRDSALSCQNQCNREVMHRSAGAFADVLQHTVSPLLVRAFERRDARLEIIGPIVPSVAIGHFDQHLNIQSDIGVFRAERNPDHGQTVLQ